MMLLSTDEFAIRGNKIMKQGRTELVFILDRSGSMSGLEQDTIGGFNSLLTKQKAQSGDCTVTTVLFDNAYELLHDRIKTVERQLIVEVVDRVTTHGLNITGRKAVIP